MEQKTFTLSFCFAFLGGYGIYYVYSGYKLNKLNKHLNSLNSLSISSSNPKTNYTVFEGRFYSVNNQEFKHIYPFSYFELTRFYLTSFWFTITKRPSTYSIEKTLPILKPSISENNNFTFTWLGHSTCFFQIEGVRILTDPISCKKFGLFGPSRLTNPVCDYSELKPDVVLISSNRTDFLNEDVVKIGNSATWYIPIGTRSRLSKAGIYKIVELGWWEEYNIKISDEKNLRIAATPLQHYSGTSLFDFNKSLWNGYILKSENKTVFHCAASAFNNQIFNEVKNQYGPIDLSTISIGSYSPSLFEKYFMTPQQAINAHNSLNSKTSYGIYWGTYLQSKENYLDPPKILFKYRESSKISVCRLGHTQILDEKNNSNQDKNDQNNNTTDTNPKNNTDVHSDSESVSSTSSIVMLSENVSINNEAESSIDTNSEGFYPLENKSKEKHNKN